MMNALDARERKLFRDHGFLVRRACLPSGDIAAASKLVRTAYALLEQTDVQQYSDKTFFPSLESVSQILSLYRRATVEGVARQIVGQILPVKKAQIAVRLPASRFFQSDKPMHVDGVNCPHLDSGTLNTFNLLVGVFLSEVRSAESGALRVIPGGHRRMAEWFASGEFANGTEQVPRDVLAAEEYSIVGRPGDVLFMHHLLPHTVGAVEGDEPRFMLYFRVSSTRLSTNRIEALTDVNWSMSNLEKALG